MARSGKRSHDVHQFPTTEPGKFIEIKVAYCEGGPNYFSGATNDRAYYLHATPVEIENRDGGVQIKSFKMFHGVKSKIEDAKRFSDKKLSALVEQTRQECESRADKIMRLVGFVLSEENLTLAEETVPA